MMGNFIVMRIWIFSSLFVLRRLTKASITNVLLFAVGFSDIQMYCSEGWAIFDLFLEVTERYTFQAYCWYCRDFMCHKESLFNSIGFTFWHFVNIIEWNIDTSWCILILWTSAVPLQRGVKRRSFPLFVCVSVVHFRAFYYMWKL